MPVADIYVSVYVRVNISALNLTTEFTAVCLVEFFDF